MTRPYISKKDPLSSLCFQLALGHATMHEFQTDKELIIPSQELALRGVRLKLHHPGSTAETPLLEPCPLLSLGPPTTFGTSNSHLCDPVAIQPS